jgi:hypothetical protein
MSDGTTPPDTKPAKAEPTLACVVTAESITYGDVILGKGYRFKLPKSEAEALASIGHVQITGL